MALLLEIITPDGISLSSPVETVTMNTTAGQLTLLPGHAPLMGQTSTGELLYRDKQGSHVYAIDKGFFLLKGDKLSLLVEGAVDSAAIDLAAIKDAQERAKAALASTQKMDPAEIEEFERIVRFTIAQQLIKARK